MTQTYRVREHSLSQLAGLLAVLVLFPFAGAHADNMKAGTGIEVNIGSNGGVLVRGAQVTSVNDATINADTSLGSMVLSWIVQTDADTNFSTQKGGATGIANIAVGDIVSFRGAIDQNTSGLTVRAKQVKDWTVLETKTKIEGIVSSINTTLNSFTIKRGDATTTVQTNSSTKFTEDGDSASFADIILNAKVKIAGLFNASSSVMTANSVEIDEDGSWDKDDNKEWREWIKSKVWLKLWH